MNRRTALAGTCCILHEHFLCWTLIDTTAWVALVAFRFSYMISVLLFEGP